MSKHRWDRPEPLGREQLEELAAAAVALPEIREIVPVAGTGQHVDPVLVKIVLDLLDGFEPLVPGSDPVKLH